MKKLFSLILILISLTSQSQVITKDMIKPIAFRSGLMIVSGFSDGTAEVLRINYSRFEARFPNANGQYWNPNESYKNKWKNGDINQGEKFFLSSTALVWTTDGYHMARMVRNCTMVAAVTIPIGKHKPRKWYSYVAESAIYYVSYTAGFNLAYDVVFK